MCTITALCVSLWYNSIVNFVITITKQLALSAIAERPRSMVGQFRPKYKWKTTLFSKHCRCQKTKASVFYMINPSLRLIQKTAALRF